MAGSAPTLGSEKVKEAGQSAGNARIRGGEWMDGWMGDDLMDGSHDLASLLIEGVGAPVRIE